MTNIDETELARLEALALDSQKRYVPRFVYEACNAVPALVAEVRRLREKVEAWAWLHEVEGLFRLAMYRKRYWRWRSGAYDELAQSLIAAREAVHADRE